MSEATLSFGIVLKDSRSINFLFLNFCLFTVWLSLFEKKHIFYLKGLSVTIDDRTFNIFVKGAARKAAQLGRDAVDVAAEFVQNSLRKTFDKHRKPLIDLDDLNLFKYLPKQNDGYEVYEVMSKPHIRQDEPSHYAPTPTIAPAGILFSQISTYF